MVCEAPVRLSNSTTDGQLTVSSETWETGNIYHFFDYNIKFSLSPCPKNFTFVSKVANEIILNGNTHFYGHL